VIPLRPADTVRFYVSVRINGRRTVGGWPAQALPDDYLNALHGAVVNEHIRRERLRAKAERCREAGGK
jgi:hypothetical protein